MADFLDISGLLYPTSIAVVGASGGAVDVGGAIVDTILRCGFTGPVYAVGRGATTIRTVPCFPSVAALPQAPAMVVIAQAGDRVAATIRECAARGTRHGVALANLATETGAASAAQNAIAAACRDTGFTLCGPTCLGIVSSATPIAATSAAALSGLAPLRAGPISIVVQRGVIGATVAALVQRAGCGFRHLIDSGSEAVVGFADYLHGLAHDDGTRVIAACMAGTGDGARLLRALEAAGQRGKPVVMIRAGAPPGGLDAFDAILQELGVIRARSVEELVDVCALLAATGGEILPRGRGVGIVGAAAGLGALAAGQCAAHGLSVPAEPLDMPPGTNSPAQLRLAVDALASRPDIDSLVFVLGADPMAAAELGDMIAAYAAACAKPVCLCWPAPPPGGVARLAAAGIATFDDSDRALRALAQLATRTAALARPQREGVADMAFDWATHIESHMTVVPEDRCHAILIDAGLPVARGRLAVDAAAALPIAHEIGLPVALKSITATAIDRAGAGLLVTDLRNADEVLAAYRRLEDRARGREIVLDGIYVQRMLRGGVELMVSVVRDPVFGTMVTCGSGAEPDGDRVTLRAPVTEAMAADMVTRLRCRAAARDEQGIFDVAAPAAFIARLSSLGVSAPWRAFTFKVSPIRWTRAGVVAMDGLLVIER